MYDPHSTGPYFSLSVQIMISLASVLCFSASGISDKAEVSRAHPFRSASDFAVSDQARLLQPRRRVAQTPPHPPWLPISDFVAVLRKQFVVF